VSGTTQVAPVSTTFITNDRVQVTAKANVRKTASLQGRLGAQAIGALGTVISGPITANGYTWYEINYDSGVDGWTADISLIKTTIPPPSPIVAIGDRIEITVGPKNVRTTYSTKSNILGSQPVGALGTVISGPITANGYTWYEINYDNAPDGWSVENGLVIVQSAQAPVSTKFSLNDRITVTDGPRNVRTSGSMSATILGTQPVGALGTVIGGPVLADGYTWWNINYDNAPDGWSGDDGLAKM
jgi:hypothetical protein